MESERERSAEELACSAQAGSLASFEELVARFQRPLFRFLLLRAPSLEDAEELTQDSFVRAWQRIGLYDPRHRFSTWLFTLARRLAASRARRARSGATDERASELVCAVDPPALLAAREERLNLWSLARRLLGVEQCSALWLRYAEDLAVPEIARILGRRPVTVRVQLFRARARLARHLDPQAVAHLGPRAVELAGRREFGGRRCAP